MGPLWRFAGWSGRLLYRLWAWIFVLTVGLAVAALLILRGMFREEEIRSIIETQLQQAFRRPVLVGEVRGPLYKGIRVRGLKVLDPPGFAGPGIPADGPGGAAFVSSDVMLATYRWAPLLRRRLELGEFRLVGPRIRLVRRADGEWNVSDYFSSTEVARGLPPLALAAELIAVEKGVLSVHDVRGGRSYSVTNLDLEVRGLAPAGAFPVKVSFDSTSSLGGRSVDVRASFEAAVDLAGYRWEDARAEAKRIEGSVAGRPAAASVEVRGFRHPAIEARLELPAMEPAFLARLSSAPAGLSLPASAWRGRLASPATGQWELSSLDVAAPPLRVRASGRLDTRGPKPRWRATASLLEFPLEKAGEVWSPWAPYALRGTLSGTVAAAGNSAFASFPESVKSLSLRLRGLGVVWKGGHHLSGTDVGVEGGEHLDNLTATVSRGRLVFWENELDELDVRLQVRKEDIGLERVKARWGTSRLDLTGRVIGLAPPRVVSLKGKVDKVRLEEVTESVRRIIDRAREIREAAGVPPPEGPRLWSRVFKYSIPKSFPATSGEVKVDEVLHKDFRSNNLDLTWDLRGISTGLDDVEGSIRLALGPGQVFDIPALQGAHKILRIVFLPFVFMRKLNNSTELSLMTLYPERLDFNRINGVYGLKKGVANVCYFCVYSVPFDAYADGVVDFPSEKVNLHILTRLSEKDRGVLPEVFSDMEGKTAIGFYVENDLNKPDLRLQYRKMEKNAAPNSCMEAAKRCEPPKQ